MFCVHISRRLNHSFRSRLTHKELDIQMNNGSKVDAASGSTVPHFPVYT
jgi:hypothetical protein